MKVIDLTNLRTGIINNGFVTWHNGVREYWGNVCLTINWEIDWE